MRLPWEHGGNVCSTCTHYAHPRSDKLLKKQIKKMGERSPLVVHFMPFEESVIRNRHLRWTTSDPPSQIAVASTDWLVRQI